MTYRADIDGLRAVAVMSVVLGHVGLGFPGGFVGVDVFFVISGYLITRLMLKEIEAGSFSLVDFWQRRIRRILPAMFVVVVSALAAGWFLLVPSELTALGRSIVSVSTMQANVHFAKQVGYFAAAAEEKPLLHTWSLAVEEQFYLVVPLVVWAAMRFRNRKFLAACVAMLTLLSFAAALRGTANLDQKAYYSLITRAWELFVGVATALVAGKTLVARPAVVGGRWLHALASLLALAGIVVPALLYDHKTLFPGLAALPPVLGTALLIHLGDSGASRTWLHRLLAWRGFVAVGLISYSLYLWHWPLLVYWKRHSVLHRLDADLTTGEQIGIVVAGMALATISYFCIERPFRRRDFFASRRQVFGGAALSFVCLMVCGQAARLTHGFPSRLPVRARDIASTATMDLRYARDMTADDVPTKLLHVGNEAVAPRFFVWGDSHAMSLLPAIRRVCDDAGVSAAAAVHAGWPPTSSHSGIADPSHPAFVEAVFEHLAAGRYEAVLLVGYWPQYRGDPNFARALVTTVERLQASGQRVYYLKTVPTFNYNVPDVVMRRLWSGGDLTALAVSADRYAAQNPLDAELLPQLRDRGVTVLDTFPSFQRHFGTDDVLPFDDRGLFYRDAHHLSVVGAETIVSAFAPLVADLDAPHKPGPVTARAPKPVNAVR